MNMIFNFYNPTNLFFGRGALRKLGSLRMPGEKAMLLISNGKSTKANGAFERTVQGLKQANVDYAVFDKIMENPLREIVMEGAGFATKNGCDFIVALGGAVLDAAIAIAAMATNPGDLWDYVQGGTGKGKPLVNKGLPIVTIATTAGTGSEINAFGDLQHGNQ